MLGDVDVVSPLLEAYAKAAEALGNDAELVVVHVGYGELALVDGCHAYERAYFDHVGQNHMGSSVELFYSGDFEQVGANAFDFGTHSYQELAELLHVRLAGGVVDGGRALGEGCGHYDVGGTGH